MSNARFSILQASAVKDRDISDAQFRTLAALGMYADQDGWCFPMLATLGKDLQKSKQSVGRDTIALRKLGYLEVHARYNENGGRRSNLYRLRFDFPIVNVDDSTPLSCDDSTPSIPEVDVNDPKNDPKEQGDFSKSKKHTAYRRGETPLPDKAMEYIQMSQAPGIKKTVRVDNILSYLGVMLHKTTTAREWEELAKWIDDRQQKDGQKVEVFVAWVLRDKYEPQYWTVKRIMENWPAAFVDAPKDTGRRMNRLERD